MPGEPSKRALPPLLPRSGDHPASPNSPVGALPEPSTWKRAVVAAACESCRAKKSKCDGRRPTCTSCSRSGRSCHYSTAGPSESRVGALKRKHHELEEQLAEKEELLTLMRARPINEAEEILRRIRDGDSPVSIVRDAKGGNFLHPTLAPETSYRYEFPNLPHLPPMFEDVHNPYLAAPMHDLTMTPSDISTASLEIDGFDAHDMYQAPYRSAYFADSRLNMAQASTWTMVTSDSALIAKLISLYLQFEFPSLPAFQLDLFLDDFVNGKKRFCSSLLVNAILASGSHAYTEDPNRAEAWSRTSLGYGFMAEAKRLWEFECAKDKLTTVQAAMILSTRYNADGADRIGVAYAVQAVAMANRMQLFTPTHGHGPRSSLGRTVTAWCLFNWQSHICYYTHNHPFLREPPSVSLPDYSSISTVTGDIKLKYPGSQSQTPLNFGQTWKAWSGLRIIMAEITSIRHDRGRLVTELTMDQTIEIYLKLETWYESLPRILQADKVAFLHHFTIHMEYHHIVIELFEPWNSIQASAMIEEKTLGRINPQAVSRTSKARLEVLIRLYYLRHGFEDHDILLPYYLLLLGSFAINELATTAPPPSTLSSLTTILLLCTKGLHDQGRNNYVGVLLYHLLKSSIRTEEHGIAAELRKIEQEFRVADILPEHIQSDWPVYRWISAGTERLDKLLELWDDLSIGDSEGSLSDPES